MNQASIINEFSKVPLLPYYVYVLLNPLKNNKPFYVGKGTGNRVKEHERDIQVLLNDEKRKFEQQEQELEQEPELEQEVNAHDSIFQRSKHREDQNKIMSEKQEEIKALLEAGVSPLQVILGRYETEDEAYAVEAALIHLVFGYENLTNIANGHGYKFLRTKNEYDYIVDHTKKQEDIPERKGIDIEQTIRSNEYRDQKILALTEAGAYELLAELHNALTESGFNWRNFTNQGDKYFHPGESNGYLAVIVRIGEIDFNVQFTKKKTFSIQFIYTPIKPKNIIGANNLALERLTQVQRASLKISLGKPKAGNKYSWILPEGRFKFTSIKGLIAELREIKRVIETDTPRANNIDLT